MSIYKFGYAKVGEKEYPLIPISLRHGSQELTTLALIDSGATISVFRSEVAEALDLDWRKGEEMLLQSANAKFAAYVNKMKVRIEDTELTLKIAFTEELTTSFNILGRESFFESFIVEINERNKIVTLTGFE